MDMIWQKITEWLKEVLVGGILDNLSGMFDNVNQKVAEIAGQVGTTPAAWNGNIFSMVRNLELITPRIPTRPQAANWCRLMSATLPQ